MALSRPVMIGGAVAVLAAGTIGTVAVIAATLPTEPTIRTVDVAGTAEVAGGGCVDWTLQGTVAGDLRDVPGWMLWEAAAGGAEIDAVLSNPQLMLDVQDPCGEPDSSTTGAEVAWAVSRTCEESAATEDAGVVLCDGERRPLVMSRHGAVEDSDGAIGQLGSSIRGEDLAIGTVVIGDGDQVCFDLMVALTLHDDAGSDARDFTVPVCA